VIVLKKFNNQIFWWIPVSTKTKIGKYYHSFFMNESEQMAIISQMRLFDGKRILDKLWMISNPDFLAIKQKIKELLE
jgi:mRNA interferase MazF